MAQIRITRFVSTSLDAAYARIGTIEIEDRVLGEGGFGAVYRALSLDNRKLPTAQVIKIFHDNGKGSAQRGASTIQEMQARLRRKNQELLSSGGRPLLDTFPPLLGVPQFSFDGTLNGQKVQGYSANNLSALGFEDFGELLGDDQRNAAYQAIPFTERILIARSVAETFGFLWDELSYLHADFKAEALFVNLKTRTCAIIDYDSGAIARGPSDRPLTFGTRQDWLAPEIVDQLSSSNRARTIHVDLFSDRWSVAVGLFHLLYCCHPFFFLKELSDRCMTDYFRRLQWPEADPSSVYFEKSLAMAHGTVKNHVLTQLPEDIRKHLRFTFNQGFRSPAQRSTYAQWKIVLSTAFNPLIKSFQADRTVIRDIRPVVLSWEVSGARRIELLGVGDVTGKDSMAVRVVKDQRFTLRVTGFDGSTLEANLAVTVSKEPPRILDFRADRTLLEDENPVHLSWEVENAVEVLLSPGGRFSGDGSHSIRVRGDTRVTLTAVSFTGARVCRSLDIVVSKAPPRIVAFRADRTFLAVGEEVRVDWHVENAKTAEISGGAGVVQHQGSLVLRPGSSTEVFLTARSCFGYRSTSRLKIHVWKPARLEDVVVAGLSEPCRLDRTHILRLDQIPVRRLR